MWFDPLSKLLATYQLEENRPVLVALNGCQGSGKTTLGDYLCCALGEEFGLHAVALSLDDFYLTHGERQALAMSIHPLLATRGVPGTHDATLMRQTLERLLDPTHREPVAIPRFNKATDDRQPATHWDTVSEPVQVVILEGWCLGALPESDESLAIPVNTLERNEDPRGLWRSHVNTVLERDFQPLYSLVDQWIMLRAPSFDCVFNWRQEQERKLAATLPAEQAGELMDNKALEHFIQHYERLTRQCLQDLPTRVDHLFHLGLERQITKYEHHTGAHLAG